MGVGLRLALGVVTALASLLPTVSKTASQFVPSEGTLGARRLPRRELVRSSLDLSLPRRSDTAHEDHHSRGRHAARAAATVLGAAWLELRLSSDNQR